MYLFPCIVTCSDLPSLTNGNIDYGGAGSPDSRHVDTVATYTCDTGYTLNGGTTRTCGSDGVWSGSASTCQRKQNGLCTVCLLSVSSPIQLIALTYPYWSMGWLCTVMDPLTTDLSALVLCTPVTLTTLSLEVLLLEVLPGSVWMEESGVGYLQLVSVSEVEWIEFLTVYVRYFRNYFRNLFWFTTTNEWRHYLHWWTCWQQTCWYHCYLHLWQWLHSHYWRKFQSL